MSRTLLEDAFAHHVWATLRLIDACLALSPEQLDTGVPGTYGSILETVRHLVGTDSWDLFVASDERTSHIDEGRMGLAELRAAMEGHAAAWSSLLAREPDPDALLREVDEDDGYTRDIPMGIELAQALHHGRIIGARSAPPSRASAWNRRPSMSWTSASRAAAWSKSRLHPDELEPGPASTRPSRRPVHQRDLVASRSARGAPRAAAYDLR